jgi:hypothetical protein
LFLFVFLQKKYPKIGIMLSKKFFLFLTIFVPYFAFSQEKAPLTSADFEDFIGFFADIRRIDWMEEYGAVEGNIRYNRLKGYTLEWAWYQFSNTQRNTKQRFGTRPDGLATVYAPIFIDNLSLQFPESSMVEVKALKNKLAATAQMRSQLKWLAQNRGTDGTLACEKGKATLLIVTLNENDERILPTLIEEANRLKVAFYFIQKQFFTKEIVKYPLKNLNCLVRELFFLINCIWLIYFTLPNARL